MEVVEKDIQSFQKAIRDHSEFDFTSYSPTSLRRRLTRILLEYDMDMEHLTEKMISHPEFLKQTVQKITVHTTELFRDPAVWKEIRKKLLPSWKEKPEINIWHSGCSTGQYHAGETITLSASPASGWEVASWYGTDNNGSTSTTNNVTMPTGSRSSGVNYTEPMCEPKGASCSINSDCCSNKCRGKTGRKSCK